MRSETKSPNFIEQIIEDDLANGFAKQNLRFRFPPEPNGFLHIGHTKAIGISFGLGQKYQAPVNLRFDDTNPITEDQVYVDAIKEDISWLGYQWEKECYSSDYFEQLYRWAVALIKKGKAYVDSQSAEAIAEQKGTTSEPGVDSPYRNRSVETNLDLFERMKNGEFEEGEHVLRAKIDMADPNMLMRDPLMYRIIKKPHQRTATNWCIYPMYDWTHGESDYIEQISHSLCSLEFRPHRKLYDWFLNQITTTPIRPKQREFARLNLSYTIMSKRKLLRLVEEKIVLGWDDPRMPTISGLRRRGYTPDAIRKFIETVGVAKRENVIDVSLLEFCVREDLNKKANRVMAVLNPIKVCILNYPESDVLWLDAENNPENPKAGFRKVPFSRELYIEAEDFRPEAPKNYHRLTIGGKVRLKNAFVIQAESYVEEQGQLTVFVRYDPDSQSGKNTSSVKTQPKGTLHWVSVKHALPMTVRVYDRLFSEAAPDGHKETDFMNFINPDSLKTLQGFIEPSVKGTKVLEQFQFQRLGYFNVDLDSRASQLVFNKTVGLRDTWKKKVSPPNHNASLTQTIATKPPIEEIKKLGKKLLSTTPDKQKKLEIRIQEAAKQCKVEEIEPLYQTAVKKAATRLATLIALDVILVQNQTKPNVTAVDFIQKAAKDSNAALRTKAEEIVQRYSIS